MLPLQLPLTTQKQISGITSFSWVHSLQLTYLGIKLTSPGTHIFKTNYLLLLNKLSELCKDLSKVTASWAGKIVLTKMFLLPHVLYFFRAIPKPILSTHLKKLQKMVDNFIWEHKKARVNRLSFYTSILQTGLGAPNLSTFLLFYDQTRFWWSPSADKR